MTAEHWNSDPHWNFNNSKQPQVYFSVSCSVKPTFVNIGWYWQNICLIYRSDSTATPVDVHFVQSQMYSATVFRYERDKSSLSLCLISAFDQFRLLFRPIFLWPLRKKKKCDSKFLLLWLDLEEKSGIFQPEFSTLPGCKPSQNLFFKSTPVTVWSLGPFGSYWVTVGIDSMFPDTADVFGGEKRLIFSCLTFWPTLLQSCSWILTGDSSSGKHVIC